MRTEPLQIPRLLEEMSSMILLQDRAHKDGVLRWCFNYNGWRPSSAEFSFCLSLLSHTEQLEVTRFSKREDQKCTLVSRMMQRMLIHYLFDVPYYDVSILRTPEGKPFVGNDIKDSPFPTLNYSVSHHGDYVALASEYLFRVGLDVMVADTEKQKTSEAYVQNFRSYFTTQEWNNITSVAADKRLLLDQFCRYWCMKESYVKAMGIGLGLQLRRAEFFYEDRNIWSNIAYLQLDGIKQSNWRFDLNFLGDGHWVCIAKGPLDAAVPNSNKPLHVTDTNSGYPDLPYEPPFQTLTIEDLIPCSVAEEFFRFHGKFVVRHGIRANENG